jgi:hypothetical protein
MNKPMPTTDTKTGIQYPSKTKAGKAIAAEYQFDPLSNFVYYRIMMIDPTRLVDTKPKEYFIVLYRPSPRKRSGVATEYEEAAAAIVNTAKKLGYTDIQTFKGVEVKELRYGKRKA